MPGLARSATAGFAAYVAPHTIAGPILVASDTSPHSDAAFPLAQELAEHTNAAVHVMSAVRPFSMPIYAFDAVPMALDADNSIRAGREGLLRAQRARLVAPGATWPLVIRTGEPAREIVEYARELGARVIVVGRGRHAALQRALGGETVLRLLQLGDTPVLATESRLHGLAKRVVIAVDFSEFSSHAARVAISLIAPDAHVTFVHVAPPFAETDPVLQERAVAYRNQARHGFDQLHHDLVSGMMTFEDVIVDGNPSDEIMRVVRSAEADLVVTATHGYGFLRRMVLGSVAAELIRHAPCSVLCVPGSAATLLAARTRSTVASRTRTFDADVYDAELKAFGERHVARRCTVEIDERDFGAQILGHALPIVAATFDHTSQTVSLMFGTSTLAGQHMTHAIAGVTGIELSTDEEGRDRALRIAHEGGQTLVLLE